MNDCSKSQFEAHAWSLAPQEAVAFLLSVTVGGNTTEVLYPVENVHEDKRNFFQIAPESWLRAKSVGGILSIVHSHPVTIPKPSTADKVMCEESGVPWHIYSLYSKAWESFAPVGFRLPLYGREYIYGVSDCFSLLRDYYAEKLKIKFENVYRQANFWEKGLDLYNDNLAMLGFVEVQDRKLHDVVLMAIGCNVANHGAICIENDLILHHAAGRLSCATPYGGYWLKHTVKTIRHKSLC